MRVALVTNFCPVYRRPMFFELARRADLTLLFTTRGTEWYELGERPTDIEGLPTMSLPSAAGVHRELVAGGYDAVIVGLAGRATLLSAFATAKAKSLPLVLWVEIWEHPSTLVHRLSRPVARHLYRSADAIVAFGSHVADYLIHESGRKHDVFLASQAVDNERFRAPIAHQRITAFRARFGLEDEPTVAFVGRLEEDKGVGDLLQASAHTKVPHQVVIAGRGSLSATLKEQAVSLGIDGRVRFVGYLGEADVITMLHACDLLALPSCAIDHSRECWGMVVNEAMNCGLPVIASDAVGAAAGGLVVNDQTGLVVPQRDPSALAAALGEFDRERVEAPTLGRSRPCARSQVDTCFGGGCLRSRSGRCQRREGSACASCSPITATATPEARKPTSPCSSRDYWTWESTCGALRRTVPNSHARAASVWRPVSRFRTGQGAVG